jgi:hypothetical protein
MYVEDSRTGGDHRGALSAFSTGSGRPPVANPSTSVFAADFEQALSSFLANYELATEIVYGIARPGGIEGRTSGPSDRTGSAVACNCDLSAGPHHCARVELGWAADHAREALKALESANSSLDTVFRKAEPIPPPLETGGPPELSRAEKKRLEKRQRERKHVLEIHW